METMTADEFQLWKAEYDRCPWGEERADFRSGMVASTIANYSGKSREKSAPPAKPGDFMPFCQPDPIPMSDDFETINAHFGD